MVEAAWGSTSTVPCVSWPLRSTGVLPAIKMRQQEDLLPFVRAMYDGGARVVEITMTAKDAQRLSLVSLMPQEKTYNAAALSSKSNAFGGAAVVSAFQVGFSARKR